jgi:hypothetical protein
MHRIRILIPIALAALGLAAPAAAEASRSQFMIFEAPRELASADAGLRAQTLDEISGLGAKWLRVVLYWKGVAPSPNSAKRPAFDERDPAAYDWTQYDRAIGDARARGFNVLVTVSGPVPTWATGRHSGHTYKPSATRFERFVTAVGRRYGGEINTWSVWNEPNHPQFLGPQFVKGKAYSPGLYRNLWRAAVRGLKASGNGRDTMLAGETAPRGTPRVVSPISFVRGFFTRGGGSMGVDGWAHHPYTTRSGPFFKPPNRNDVTIGVLSRLTRALDQETRNGLRVYLTEFGIQSKPDPYVGVAEDRQAEYRSISEKIAYRNSRVRAFSQYMMRDDLPRAGSAYVRYSGFESGLRHSSGEAKLAYDAFRLPLVADRAGSRVSLWGLVRPTAAATTVGVQYRHGSKGAWRTLTTRSTSSGGYWSASARFRSGRVYRVVWGDHAGPATRVYR